MVSARSFISSSGPDTASRSCSLSSEIRWVAAVICRSGRSARPATPQPSATDATVMTPSPTTDPISRSWEMPEVWLCCSAASSSCNCWMRVCACASADPPGAAARTASMVDRE